MLPKVTRSYEDSCCKSGIFPRSVQLRHRWRPPITTCPNRSTVTTGFMDGSYTVQTWDKRPGTDWKMKTMPHLQIQPLESMGYEIRQTECVLTALARSYRLTDIPGSVPPSTGAPQKANFSPSHDTLPSQNPVIYLSFTRDRSITK